RFHLPVACRKHTPWHSPLLLSGHLISRSLPHPSYKIDAAPTSVFRVFAKVPLERLVLGFAALDMRSYVDLGSGRRAVVEIPIGTGWAKRAIGAELAKAGHLDERGKLFHHKSVRAMFDTRGQNLQHNRFDTSNGLEKRTRSTSEVAGVEYP